jgi:hypothetical protein
VFGVRCQFDTCACAEFFSSFFATTGKFGGVLWIFVARLVGTALVATLATIIGCAEFDASFSTTHLIGCALCATGTAVAGIICKDFADLFAVDVAQIVICFVFALVALTCDTDFATSCVAFCVT